MASIMSPPWTRVKLSLAIIFWIIQFLAVTCHFGYVTYSVGFLGLNTDIVGLKYVYITILLTTTFLLALLITECMEYFSSTNGSELFASYHRVQVLKVRFVLVEIFALAFLLHGVEDPGAAARIVFTTGLSKFPFQFSGMLAMVMNRLEKKRLEQASKESDERTPLLAGLGP